MMPWMLFKYNALERIYWRKDFKPNEQSNMKCVIAKERHLC